MKALHICTIALLALTLAGCQGEMKPIVTLDNKDAITPPLVQTTPVATKGTYYLYCSKEPDKEIYHTDLKKGEEIGFRVTGNRAVAVAKGILIELSDFSDGASYVWKLEEKKE